MTVSDLHEVAWWVLSWGRNAKALSPKALRQLLATEAERIIALYREPPDGAGQREPLPRRKEEGE